MSQPDKSSGEFPGEDGALGERIGQLSHTQRALLEQLVAQSSGGPAPRGADTGPPVEPVAYRPPRTAAEHALAAVWQEVLETEGVGIDDDYFALGGDSIHAIVIIAKARHAGLALTAADLFELRTIAALGERALPVAPPSGVGQETADEHPLTPMQQGMLYHSVGGSTPGAYVVQVCCSLTGDLDVAAFRAAWQAVVDANPALRVAFRWDERLLPAQLVEPSAPVTVETADWRPRAQADRDAAFARFLEEDRERGFDLAQAPLMRLTLLRENSEDEAEYRCVWTHHHLVLDGWSQQLVLRDVLECYERLRQGAPAAPPQRPPFTGYLRWLAEQPDMDEEFWRRGLDGVTALSRVAGPGCREGQVVAVRRGEAEYVLSKDASRELVAFGRNHGLTQASVLHGAWGLLLSLRCGLDDVVFGTTVSGRPVGLAGATECVGLFINTLPLRVSCGGPETVLEWLGGIQHGLLALRGQEHVPLSRIERSVGLGRSGGLFDTIVVVENFPSGVGDGHTAAGLKVTRPRVLVDEGYPLVLEATPRERLTLRARYDPSRLPGPDVHAWLDALADCLTAVSEQPQRPLKVLRALVAGGQAQRDVRARGQRRERDGSRLSLARRQPQSTIEGEIR